jgi:hypothetical protein
MSNENNSVQAQDENKLIAERRHKLAAILLCKRSVPKNNEYWKSRSSYLSKSPGYLFIPILLDLFLKSKSNQSISEEHIQLIEQILHHAAIQERTESGYTQLHIDCQNVLQSIGVSNDEIKRTESLVDRPFSLFPSKYKSIQRANVFLYSAALFPNDYDLIFSHWESVMPLFLFLDDLTDLQDDIANKSENCLLDSPNIENNFFELYPLFAESIKPLQKINLKIYQELDRLRQEAIVATLSGTLFSI